MPFDQIRMVDLLLDIQTERPDLETLGQELLDAGLSEPGAATGNDCNLPFFSHGVIPQL
jgi:hypothetical protein